MGRVSTTHHCTHYVHTLAQQTPQCLLFLSFLFVASTVKLWSVADFVVTNLLARMAKLRPKSPWQERLPLFVLNAHGVPGTIDTYMARVVIAVGENCDRMYGSEVWASCRYLVDLP